VIVGAIIGTGLGYLVPRLHGGTPPTLSTAEWVAIGTAPIAGAVIAQLLPAKADLAVPLHHAAILPWVAPSGGGVMLARAF
jgi:hypothetical protein